MSIGTVHHAVPSARSVKRDVSDQILSAAQPHHEPSEDHHGVALCPIHPHCELPFAAPAVSVNRVEAVIDSLRGVDPNAVFDALCTGCVREFAITGAALGFIIDGRPQGPLGASDERSRRIEELQFTYGEGPCVDANRTGHPVTESHLARASSRWPAFGPDALHAGVAAVFAIPMSRRGEGYGALDLYRDTPGPLAAGELDDASAIADRALDLMFELQSATPPGSLTPALEDMADYRAVVHQAAGMISVQLDVSVDEALVALRARAFRTGSAIGDLAAAVVARQLRLDEDAG